MLCVSWILLFLNATEAESSSAKRSRARDYRVETEPNRTKTKLYSPQNYREASGPAVRRPQRD